MDMFGKRCWGIVMNTPEKYLAATMVEDGKSQSKHPRLFTKKDMLVATRDNATLQMSNQFSQTFPAMLLRLVGTADSAGDCEKRPGAGFLGAPNNLTQANVSQMFKPSLVCASV